MGTLTKYGFLNFDLRCREDEGRAKHELKILPKKAVKQWKKFAKDDLIQKNMTKVEKILYPKHQKTGGMQYGLTVLADPHLDEYSTCTTSDGWGFKVPSFRFIFEVQLEFVEYFGL